MTRLIEIKRKNKHDDYGFEFTTSKYDGKHVCINVQPDKPAYLAGLRENDFILEVNDEPVSGLWHDAVSMKMATYPRKIDMLVVEDINDYIRARRKSIIAEQQANSSKSILVISHDKEDEGIYDSMKPEVFKPATFNPDRRKTYAANSNSDSSKIQRIASNIRRSSNRPVEMQLNKIQNDVTYLSLENQRFNTEEVKPTIEKLRPAKGRELIDNVVFLPAGNLRKKSTAPMAKTLRRKSTTSIENVLSEYGRVIRLEQNSPTNDLRYYGFNFRVLQKDSHHVINSVVDGGPAFQAGIRDGDYLLEVNEETITGLNHSQALKKVLSNPKYVDLLVITDLDSYILHRQLLSQANNSNISAQEKNRYYIRKHSDQNLGLGIIPNGIINLVEPFSPADKAGVIKGLKITSINDIDVKEKNNKEIQKMVSENQNFLVIEAVLLYADKNLQQDLPETPSLTEETSDFNVQRFLNNNVRRMTTKTDRLQGQDVFEGLTKNKITPEKDRRQQTNPQQITNGRQQNKQQRHASFEEIEESVYSSSLSEISVPVTTNPVKRPSNFNQTNEFGKSPSKSSAIASRIVSDKKPSIVTTNLTKPKHSTAEIYTETSNSVIPSADIYARADSLKPVEQLIGSRTCRLLMNSNFGGYGCVLVGDEVNGIVYVGSIMPNSPALLGGLQQEDIILRINDESMTGKTSTEIVNIFSKETLIDSDTGKSILKLEVIQKKLYLPDHLETRNQSQFKLCKIELPPAVFGFGLILPQRNVKPKHTILSVEENSPAWRANVRKLDVIIEINGENIRKLDYSALIKKIENCAMNKRMDMLVISKEGYNYHKNRNKKFSSKKLVNSDYMIEEYSSVAQLTWTV